VDGSDNFPARYLINDICVKLNKPLVSGAILGFEGQVTTIVPHEGHCYRCLFEEIPGHGYVPSCSEAGVIGAIAGVIGSIQAIEVTKLIINKGRILKNSLIVYDAFNETFREIKVPKDPDCPACGNAAVLDKLIAGNQDKIICVNESE
jgi:molybdopterin/thiamine biosynthesis adenylyltransferase